MTYGKCVSDVKCVPVFSTSYVGNVVKVEQDMCRNECRPSCKMVVELDHSK